MVGGWETVGSWMQVIPSVRTVYLLTRNFQLIGLTTICIVIANARKLAFYACTCINYYNMKTKRPTKNHNYLITHHWISAKMAPSRKLAVISKMHWGTSLVKNQLVLLHFLYIIVEKQPYLMSTSSYQLSVKSILFLTCIQFRWCLEKSKWQSITWLLYWIIRQCEIHHFIRSDFFYV